MIKNKVRQKMCLTKGMIIITLLLLKKINLMKSPSRRSSYTY